MKYLGLHPHFFLLGEDTRKEKVSRGKIPSQKFNPLSQNPLGNT